MPWLMASASAISCESKPWMSSAVISCSRGLKRCAPKLWIACSTQVRNSWLGCALSANRSGCCCQCC
ncbi:Uncharacterised protein [Vibrio cholerae]|nr:Uncharacterised protein [Vibrio cholerae]